MRPVNKPTPPVIQDPSTVKPSQLGDLLLATLGPYCSICEQVLDDPIVIQSKISDKTRFTFGDWENLLLVCPNCNANAREAFLDKENFKGAGQSLWPDVTGYTLSLDRGDPFQYALQIVKFVSVGETGERKSLPDQQQVIVKVNPASRQKDSAANTLKLFALNTRYYDDRSNTMTIPFASYDLIDDPRLQRRTEAWQLAAKAAERLRAAASYPVPYAMLSEQIADTARACGFWSVWMTVFWQAFGDATLLDRLFIETTNRQRFVFYGFQENSKTGPFLFFPGTDKTRISYKSASPA
jgi:hypothetical protein